jgi:hypothetical protein
MRPLAFSTVSIYHTKEIEFANINIIFFIFNRQEKSTEKKGFNFLKD